MIDSLMDSVVRDLLAIPPLLRRGINKKVFKAVFASIKESISLPHYEIMQMLILTDTLSIAEIGRKLQIPRPQMTHLIDRLEELDFVKRQVDDVDRRVMRISMTRKGREMVETHAGLIHEGVKEKLACLDTEELSKLSEALRNMREILLKLQ